MKTALITGASSGIGKELARIHASKGGDLILVARRTEALDELKNELEKAYGINVSTFTQDLSQIHAAKKVYDFVNHSGLEVDYLMNNAGFGGHGEFVDRPLDKDLEMIQLNVTALVELTHLFLQDMKERGYGKILNTASTAGFLPGPLQATYFATKAFVISFTKGISYELRNAGVTVTALCPGPVKTEFEHVAGLEGGTMFDKGASAYKTAKSGYDAMMKGKVIQISELSFAFLIKMVPFIPLKMLSAVIEKMQTVPKKS
ncbi:MAG: SDR family oxidoreductase [Flavobacteriia bacterium]